MQTELAVERLFDRISLSESGCWLARPRSDGYVRIEIGGRSFYAHRIMYEFFREAIPKGMHINHLCLIKNCLNPWHHTPVTPGAHEEIHHNLDKAHEWQRARTHCPRNHAYSEHGRFQRRGGRICLACQRLRQKRWYQERKQAAVRAGVSMEETSKEIRRMMGGNE